MNVRKRYVAVLFGAERRDGEVASPGDADCRWRVAAWLAREAAVNDAAAAPSDRPSEATDANCGNEPG